MRARHVDLVSGELRFGCYPEGTIILTRLGAIGNLGAALPGLGPGPGPSDHGVTTNLRDAPDLSCSQVSPMSSSRVRSRSTVSLPSSAWAASCA